MVTLLAGSLPAVASGSCWQCDPLEKQVSVEQQAGPGCLQRPGHCFPMGPS